MNGYSDMDGAEPETNDEEFASEFLNRNNILRARVGVYLLKRESE